MDPNTNADKQIIQVHCNCNMERPILFYMCKSYDSGKAYMHKDVVEYGSIPL
jgi:hypothetical protein